MLTIKFTALPTDAPLEFYDPYRAADILCSMIGKPNHMVVMITRECGGNEFIVYDTKRFCTHAVWTRYHRMVTSRADRKWERACRFFDRSRMKAWLDTVLFPSLDGNKLGADQ